MQRDSLQSQREVNRAHAEIHAWLENVSFRRAVFGVSEEDVWKKIEELDALYTQALYAERVRYDVLLTHLTGNEKTIQPLNDGSEDVAYDKTDVE